MIAATKGDLSLAAEIAGTFLLSLVVIVLIAILFDIFTGR